MENQRPECLWNIWRVLTAHVSRELGSQQRVFHQKKLYSMFSLKCNTEAIYSVRCNIHNANWTQNSAQISYTTLGKDSLLIWPFTQLWCQENTQETCDSYLLFIYKQSSYQEANFCFVLHNLSRIHLLPSPLLPNLLFRASTLCSPCCVL